MLLAVYVFKAVTQNLRGITMAYPNTQQTKAIPFFARFLSVDQEEAPTPESPDFEPAPIWTLKWPSDWEDS